MFEYFEHTADAGVRILAPDKAGLFRDAAMVLFSLIVEEPENVRAVQHRLVKISGADDAYLLIDWLNELLYLHATQHLVFSQFDVSVTDEGIEADVAGEPLDSDRHSPLHEVKAITCHGLEVKQTKEGWRGTFIVDI